MSDYVIDCASCRKPRPPQRINERGFCSWCVRSVAKANVVVTAEDFAEQVRVSRLAPRLRKFALTLERFDQMAAEQGGRCAICGNPPAGSQVLSIDHDHETGRVRGLLCTACNTGIGHLQDSIEVLKAAVAYLERHDSP